VKDMEIKKVDFESIYFDFFDLGNYTVIFDTMMDPYGTDDLIKASRQFTNKEPSFVINSHYHMDHLYGNRKFPLETPIISSSETLSVYHENLDDYLKRLKGIATEELKRTKEVIKKETAPNKILEFTNDINTYTEMLKEDFQFRPPDFIINDSFTIEGTENRVQIIYIGDAHTPGDLLAYFEKEKICFMGDLLFEVTDPNWATTTDPAPVPANPQRLRDTLIDYMEKNIDIYIPGHGKICSKKQLKENAEFLEEYFIKASNNEK
jgi:glyoxylase-like metal-dependent hydrolase (beta-lactamase superfamily II)